MNYIAIEGIDNCGKSTIIKNLKKDFPEFNYVREPGTTKYAEELRQVMFSNINVHQLAIQCAMTSARIDLANNLLSLNKDTISDRCFLSFAYATDFDEAMCDKLLDINKSLVPILPNVIIYLEVSSEESVKRFKRKRMEGYDTINVEAINKRIERYNYLINKVSELNISKVIRVNTEKEFGMVYNEVRSIVYECQRKTNSTCQNTSK